MARRREVEYYYHLSPRKYRSSIYLRGLRVMSWLGSSLALWCSHEKPDDSMVRHIARRHNVSPEEIDLWRFDAPVCAMTYRHGGLYTCAGDIPPSSVTLFSAR